MNPLQNVRMFDDGPGGGMPAVEPPNLQGDVTIIHPATGPTENDLTLDDFEGGKLKPGREGKVAPTDKKPSAEAGTELETDDLDIEDVDTDEGEADGETDDQDTDSTGEDGEYFENEAQMLAELGLEGDSVYKAMVDLLQKQAELERQFDSHNPIVKQLNDIAGKLNATPQEVLQALSDMRTGPATQGPSWEALDGWLGKFVNHENHGFYKDMANAMMESIAPQIEARYARVINGYDSKIDRLQFELNYRDFIGNEKNAEWKGRSEDVWKVLQENPKWMGKPNQIDLATRFLKVDQPDLTPKADPQKMAQEIAKKKVQELINKRGGKLRRSSGGRNPQTKGKTKDPTSLDYGMEQRGQLIDQLEAKGFKLG